MTDHTDLTDLERDLRADIEREHSLIDRARQRLLKIDPNAIDDSTPQQLAAFDTGALLGARSIDPATLTDDERHAIDLTAQLANTIGRIVSDGPTRNADLAELVHHIHAIQHTVMAQAAARAYPSTFRLLGETIR